MRSAMGVGGIDAANGSASESDARLREVSRQLEGVFIAYLFKAMRETVPDGGLTDGGHAEDVFSGMMDSQIATSAALRMRGGISEAVYRQLRSTATPQSDGEAAVDSKGIERDAIRHR